MKPKKKGQTLVEVTVATIIAATTAMAVFSVMLSSFASQQKADKREAAGFILKQAQETLKSYVSADPSNADMFPGSSPAWPGAPGSTVGRWPDDSSGGWALAGSAAGLTHDITSLLDGTSLAGTGSSFDYTVNDTPCGFGTGATACKTVQFKLVYQDQ